MASQYCGHWCTRPQVKHNLKRAEKLLEAGADVDSKDAEGWCALHWAAAEGRTRVIAALLGRRATVDAVDLANCTPLWCAAFNGEYQAALLLLAGGADLTIKGQPRGDASPSAPGLAARGSVLRRFSKDVDRENEEKSLPTCLVGAEPIKSGPGGHDRRREGAPRRGPAPRREAPGGRDPPRRVQGEPQIQGPERGAHPAHLHEPVSLKAYRGGSQVETYQ